MPVRATMRLSAQDAAVALNGGPLAVNMVQMQRAGPNRPRITTLIEQRKLRYSRHDPAEHWQTYDEILHQIERTGVAYADCEDLAAMLAAEMRIGDGKYVDPDAQTEVYRTGPNMSHVVVKSRRYGRLDPSKWAGMGWNEVSAEDARRHRLLLGLPGSPDEVAGCPASPLPAHPPRPGPGRARGSSRTRGRGPDVLGAIAADFFPSDYYGADSHPVGDTDLFKP